MALRRLLVLCVLALLPLALVGAVDTCDTETPTVYTDPLGRVAAKIGSGMDYTCTFVINPTGTPGNIVIRWESMDAQYANNGDLNHQLAVYEGTNGAAGTLIKMYTAADWPRVDVADTGTFSPAILETLTPEPLYTGATAVSVVWLSASSYYKDIVFQYAAGPCAGVSEQVGTQGFLTDAGDSAQRPAGGTTCTWRLRTQDDHGVDIYAGFSLYFTRLDLSDGATLEVLDVSGGETDSLHTWDHTSTNPGSWWNTASVQVLELRYTAGAAPTAGAGIEIAWRARTCHNMLRMHTPSGAFTDGSLPSAKRTSDYSALCAWQITPSSGDGTLMLNLRQSTTYRVQIFEGPVAALDKLLFDTGTWTSNDMYVPEVATYVQTAVKKSALVVYDPRSEDDDDLGFLLEYDLGFCDDHDGAVTIYGRAGSLSDSGGSDVARGGATCTWTLMTDTYDAFSLFWDRFDLQAGVDFLTVTTQEGEQVARLTGGDDLLPVHVPRTKSIVIEFTTGAATTGTGFEARYAVGTGYQATWLGRDDMGPWFAFPPPAYTITSQHGVVTDGTYREQYTTYPYNAGGTAMVRYVIQPSTVPGPLQLYFDRYSLGSRCAEEKCGTTNAYTCTCLNIYDGTEPEESARIYIPPSLMPSTLVAPSGAMLIEYTAASGNVNNRPDTNERATLGWAAHFEARTCHVADYTASMTGAIGELFDALDVDNAVRTGASCQWELLAPGDANSVFSIFPSHLDITGDPAHNYLRVYDASSGGGTGGVLKHEYVAGSPPTSFAVHNVKKLRLEWSTGEDATGTGFHLKYEVDACDGDVTLTALAGDFSDGSPTNAMMAKKLKCGWLLLPETQEADASITLLLTRMDMYRSPAYNAETPTSQLRVYDSDQADENKLISRAYGFYSNMVLSTGPKMFVALDVVDYRDTALQTGFDAHYETGFCHLHDGVMEMTTTVAGRLTNNPDTTRADDWTQRASSSCTWEIHMPDYLYVDNTVPKSTATYSTFAFYFTTLKLGAGDKIQFLDVTTGAVLEEVTATAIPPYVRLERRQSVQVVYTTGAASPGYGFDLYWSGSTCIAEPSLRSGTMPLYAPWGDLTDGSGMGAESVALPTPQFFLEQETEQLPYCVWELHPSIPGDAGVAIVVTSLDEETYSTSPPSTKNSEEVLTVLDGIAGTTQLGAWGGHTRPHPYNKACNGDDFKVLPPPMYTSLPNARIRWNAYAQRQAYDTPYYTEGQGFALRYYGGFCEVDHSGTNEPQHMELASVSGTIRTNRPGFTAPPSRPHSRCSWQLPALQIKVGGTRDIDPYNAMTIYFTRFDLSNDDRIVIEDFSTNIGRVLTTYQGGGGTVPVPFVVDRTRSIRVTFEAGANPGSGFDADFFSGHCMGAQTLKASSGHFTDGSRSDREPSTGDSNVEPCTWLVQPSSAQGGDVVDVYLERYSAGVYNRLRLYDGPTPTDELVVWDSDDLGGQYSGTRPRAPNYATFNFTTSAALFYVKFEQQSCDSNAYRYSRGWSVRYCIQADPVVTGTIPDAGIPTVGGTIDLVGTNFCPIGLDVLVGGRPCEEPAEWISNERIRCQVGPGKGTDVPVEVHANGRVSAPGLTINYAKPKVTRISPSHGKTSGGYPVTLVGENFGYRAYEGDEAVRVFYKSDVQTSYLPCVNVTWLSDNEVVCLEWLHGVGDVRAYVELADQQSDVDAVLFSFDRPSFDSIVPDTAAAQSGGSVRKIYGENFGEDKPTTLTCTVGGVPCKHITHVSDTELTIVLPAGEGSNELVIVIDGFTVENTNALQIRYAAAALVAIEPPSALRGETTSIDVLGDGFAELYTGKCRFEVFNSSLPIEVDAQWNNARSAFVCTLPTFSEFDTDDGTLMECGSAPLYVTVRLRLDGNLLPQSLDFVRYDSCVSATDGIVPRSSRLGGTTSVTVRGGGFFVSPDITCLWWRDDSEGEVEHSESTQGTYSASDDSVTCGAPAWDEAGTARMAMALNGQDFQPKDGLAYVFYPTDAHVERVRPRTGSKDGNTAITLSGPGVVATQYPKCKFGDAEPVSGTHNGVGVVCASPGGGTAGDSVLVDVALNGQDFFGLPKPFAYYNVPVTLDRVTPDSGVFTGGTRLTLTGSNLVQTNEVRVRFGGDEHTPIIVTPDDVRNGKVYLRSPPHAVGKDVLVEVSLNDGEHWSEATSTFSFTDEVTLSSHTPLFGRTTGGELLRGGGANFLMTEFSLCRMLPYDGNNEAVQTPPRAVSDDGTEFECMAPPARRGDYDLQFSNNGQEWTSATAKYTYHGCPVGQIQESYDAPCFKCPAGTHNNITARIDTECDLCALGHYSFEGAENCRPCALGYHKGLNATLEQPCAACGAQKYGDEEGLAECKLCPPLTTAKHGGNEFGAVHITECLCLPDTYTESGLPGTECIRCPPGALCKGGTDPPTGQAGFFAHVSRRTDNITFYECSPRESCLEGNVCARGYDGFMCGDCLDGFYHSSGECVQCNDLGANIFLLVVGLPLSFFFVYLIKPFISKIGVKMAIDYYQILALFGRLSNVWPESVDSGMNVFGFAYFSFDFLQFQCYSGTINYFTKWMVTVMMPVFVTVGLAIAYFSIREYLKRRAAKSDALAAKREVLLGGGGRQRAVSVFRKKGEEVRLALRADLVEPYKETAPWWEVMIIVQKLVLVLVINFVRNTDAKLLFLEFMVLWWVFCQHIFMPFKSRTDWNKIHKESEEEKAELRAEMEADLRRKEAEQRKLNERGGPSDASQQQQQQEEEDGEGPAAAQAPAAGLGALGNFVRGEDASKTVSVNLGAPPVAPLPEHPRTEEEHYALQHPLLEKHMKPGWKGLPFRVYANVAPWAGNYNMLQYVLLLGVALTLFGGSVYRSSESPAHAPKFVWFIMSMSMIYVAPFIYCDCIEGYMERREEVRKENRQLDEFGKQHAKTKTLEERLLLFYFSFLQLIYMQITTVPFEVFDCTTQPDGIRTINAAPANECATLSDFYPSWIGLLGGLFWGFGILIVDLWVVHGSIAAMKKSFFGAVSFAKAAWDDRFTAVQHPIAHIARDDDGSTYLQMVDEKNVAAENAAL